MSDRSSVDEDMQGGAVDGQPMGLELNLSGEEEEPEDDGDSSPILKHLSVGFRAIRQRRDIGPTGAVVRLKGTQSFLSHAIINFVDPTSTKAMSPAKGKKPPLELYRKLVAILERDYSSTLRNVPFQHFRSGANGVIDSLPIKTFMTGSHGGLVSLDGHADGEPIPWAGAGPSGNDCDPSDWHCSPYCHVYIAACEGLDDYRTKVKPSIQAFLSQIEAASRSMGTTAAGGGSQYVIVFVPTGGRSAAEENQSGMSRMGAFASRVVGARQRISRDLSSEASVGPGTPDTSIDFTFDGTVDASASDYGTIFQAATNNLSKIDREVARRFAHDFSSGRVCTLSSLYDVKDEDELDEANDMQRLEWQGFLTVLAGGIAAGFRERCSRYDAELRRLDMLRASARGEEFDLSHYFLVKESLSFTYEQMCLPSEALIQYDEVSAVLPDVEDQFDDDSDSSDDEDAHKGDKPESFLSGDSIAFRKFIKVQEDLQSVANLIQEYLFARSIALLFKMNRSVEVVERCYAFVRMMFEFQHSKVEDHDIDGHVQVEKWAFQFCWDVKKACDLYLTDDVSEDMYPGDPASERGGRIDEALACCVCDVLEFTRLRMLRLGDLCFDDNPARAHNESLSNELRKTWEPWQASPAKPEDEDDAESSGFRNDATTEFVRKALESDSSFIVRYLEVVKILESFNRFAGRDRMAARLCLEIAAIHVERQELKQAAHVLQSTCDVYLFDRWDSCHFLVLFQLACFQRRVGNACDYLDTLVQCFSPLHAISAPSKALAVLHTDLKAVLDSSLVAHSRLVSAPLFEPVVGIGGVPPSFKPGADRDLLKKVYTVGEKAVIAVDLKCYLPSDVEIDCISVDLISYQQYVIALEESTVAVGKEDVSGGILTFKGPLAVQPGLNEMEFEWVPMISGQYILSSVTVHWKDVRFWYKARTWSRQTIRIDATPSEPTQSVKFVPEYLVPLHEQPLSIAFSSGTDTVKDAKLKLMCSPGMLIKPLKNIDCPKWCAASECALPPCPPGETVEVKTLVKHIAVEGLIDTSTAGHGPLAVYATVSTQYHCPRPDVVGSTMSGVDEADFFTGHTCSATATTLDLPAVSIERHEVVPYSLDTTILILTLRCNTPASLILKSWKLTLPPFLRLVEQDGGDFNACFVNARLHCDEQICLTFNCVSTAAETDADEDEDDEDAIGPNVVVGLEDEYSHCFEETLPLEFRKPTVGRSFLPTLAPIPITVVPSKLDGRVGVPITLTCTIDTSQLNGITEGRVRYAVSVDTSDWIISGKRQGRINTGEATNGKSSLEVNLVAIPTRPGVISRYPSVSVYFESDELDVSVPLATCEAEKPPGKFISVNEEVHTTIAVPISTKKAKS